MELVTLIKPRPTTACAAVLCMLLSGCALYTARKQQEKIALVAQLWGTLTTEHESTNPLVVLLMKKDRGETELFDHFVLDRPGRWTFKVTPGTWYLAAFEDVSGDLVYHPDEPALASSNETTFELGPSEIRRDIELVIPTEGRTDYKESVRIQELQARTVPDQTRVSLGQLSVLGEVVDFADPRFEYANGDKGMWAPMDFVLETGAGIYFLGEYDPRKIPVLFVHGIKGTPRDFEYLVGNLDHSRFQPWLVYYPSGAKLARIAEYLSQIVVQARVRYGFKKLFVVAHSMGGLVSRSFIQKHYAETGNDSVKLFVSISTPWDGQEDAGTGVKYSPVVVYSWADIAPRSDFLKGIFYRGSGNQRQRYRLPEHVAYHLIFGYKRNEASSGPSSDKVITLSSQLRAEAQYETHSIHGLDYGHTSILESGEASSWLNRLLASSRE